jgi:hypothetical protein
MPQPSHCATCGREFKYGQVLHGWSPCKCGGHAYAYCREDKGGCGETTYDPPIVGTCRRGSFGYEGTS